MIDYGQRQTDAVISQMDRVIADIYRQTEEELQKKLDDYLTRFKIKDAIKCEMLQKGEITLEEYNYWRTGQIMIGKRWEEMRDVIAQDLHNANDLARSVVYGHTPEVYALNHNYATFQVEKASLVDTSYTLYDRQTVERIMRSNPDLLPPPGPRKKAEIAAGKDIKWQSRQLQSAMTKSILAGDSIPHIAKRLSNELSVTNRKAAERYARTAATGAQNAGRVDAYRRAQDMGIGMEQEWLATLDDRTRHEHRYLDGQHVPAGEPFTVDGYELRFPGDPAGPGYLIWNCRCTLVPRLKSLDQSEAPRDSKLGDMTYDEWKGELTTVPNYTDYEIEQLQQYTRSSYSGVNSYLRGEEFFKSEYVEQIVDGIDSAMDKSPIPKETTVFRGASDADLRGMFGDGLRRSWFEKADNLRSLEGKTGIFQSYLSTSVGGLQGQFSHGLEWTFIADKGAHAVDLRNISVQSSENEFLFDRNSKIEILKVDVNEDEEGYIYGVIKILARIRRD